MLASGWDFSEILNPDPRNSGSGFLNLGYIEKSRKPRNPGDRDWDWKIPKKSLMKNLKNPKIPGIGIYFFRDIPKWWRPRASSPHKLLKFWTEIWNNLKKYKKKFRFSRFSDYWNFLGKSPGFGIFSSLGFFIHRIFAKSPEFMQNLRDSRFFRDFLPTGYPGDFFIKIRGRRQADSELYNLSNFIKFLYFLFGWNKQISTHNAVFRGRGTISLRRVQVAIRCHL